MAKSILTGSFVALITPFADDGSVDIEGFGKLIEFQVLNGTSAVLIMGSTGEVSLLSKEERHRVIAETVPFKRFGLPLFYGCTANNTRETYLRILPLIQFTYSKVNPVPVKSLARVLGLPAGVLRKPYLNMTGRALRAGLDIVQRLGLAEQYGYRVREDLIGEDAPEELASTSVPALAASGSGACFIG